MFELPTPDVTSVVRHWGGSAQAMEQVASRSRSMVYWLEAGTPMDIWGWVHEQLALVAEQDVALAHQLDALSTWTVDGQHGRVDAVLPGVVARVKGMGLPWLEVYARHWGLQSRVLHRYDVRGEAMREAISLLERAHRPDTADCPQSVCVSQDVCAAYGIVDGPGYARQRIEVARETLARIDPSWPCWSCLTQELVDAMADAGETEEALAWLDAQAVALQREGRANVLQAKRAQLLRRLGRLEEALEAAHLDDVSAHGETARQDKALEVASCLAALGRFDEAFEEAPAWEAVRGEVGHYPELLALWRQAIAVGALNWELEHTAAASEMLRTLASHQANRLALEESLAWAALALEHDAWSLARVLVELAEGCLPRLAAPLGADEACAATRARVEASAPEPYGRDEWEAVLETDAWSFDRMEATAFAAPEQVDLVALVAGHWLRRGWPEVAEALVLQALEKAPLDPGLLDLRLSALVQERRWSDLDAVLATLPEGLPDDVELQRRWYRSLLRQQAGDLAGATEDLTLAWTEHRERVGPGIPRRLVQLHQQAGQLEAALAVQHEIVVQEWSTSDDHWYRMEIATLLERWDVVRQSAAAVGVELASEAGPIEEAWGVLALLLPDVDGECYAVRTGPCTARVIAVTGPERPEVYGALWAFDPFPAGEGPPKVFRGNRELEPSDAETFVLDGARPTDAEVERIMTFATSHGGRAFRASGDPYRMWSPEDDAAYPASYVKVALPRAAGAAPALAELFQELAAGHERPMIWPELRETLGDVEGAARDRGTGEAWRL